MAATSTHTPDSLEQLEDESIAADDDAPAVTRELSVFDAVEIEMDARLGTLEFTIKELMELKRDSVVTLDRKLGDPVELLLKGKTVARGDLVAVGDYFAVRIIEIADLK